MKGIWTWFECSIAAIAAVVLYIAAFLLRLITRVFRIVLNVPELISMFIAGAGVLLGGMLLVLRFTGNVGTSVSFIVQLSAGLILISGITYYVLKFLGGIVVGLCIQMLEWIPLEFIVVTLMMHVQRIGGIDSEDWFQGRTSAAKKALLLPLYACSYICKAGTLFLRILRFAVYPIIVSLCAMIMYKWLYQDVRELVISGGNVIEYIVLAIIIVATLLYSVFVAGVISDGLEKEREYQRFVYDEVISILEEILAWLIDKDNGNGAKKHGGNETEYKHPPEKNINNSMFAGVRNKKELHQKYRQLIKEYHPDTHPDMLDANERTAKIISEYNEFKDYFDE